MPDWVPWALLVAVYIMAGVTTARHCVLMDELAAALSKFIGKDYKNAGSMRKLSIVIVVIWPLLFWTSFS